MLGCGTAPDAWRQRASSPSSAGWKTSLPSADLAGRAPRVPGAARDRSRHSWPVSKRGRVAPGQTRDGVAVVLASIRRPPRSPGDAPMDALSGPNVAEFQSKGHHQPLRPTWKCNTDGQDWPCAPAREHMLTTWTDIPRGMTMAGYFLEA